MHSPSNLFILFFLIAAAMSCTPTNETQNYIPVLRENFQVEHNGTAIDLFTLKNSQGMVVQITN